MTHTRKWVKFLVMGGLLITLVGGGLQWYSQTQAKSANQHVVLVRTQIVGNKNARQQFIYSGEVHGRVESQLAFQVGGKISKRNVELGSRVSQGDILLQIDPKDIHQTVNSTSAQVSSAQAQLRLAASNLQRYRNSMNRRRSVERSTISMSMPTKPPWPPAGRLPPNIRRERTNWITAVCGRAPPGLYLQSTRKPDKSFPPVNRS